MLWISSSVEWFYKSHKKWFQGNFVLKARTEAGGKFNNIENNEGLKLNIDVITDSSLYYVAALLLWHKANSRWYGQTSADSYQNVNSKPSDFLRIGERYNF